MNFAPIDVIVFVVYILVIVSIGLWVSRDKQGHEKNAEDYFLAGKSLPWWAIGASLIAANISAEQFIGMSGSRICNWSGNCIIRMDGSVNSNYCCQIFYAGVY